METEIATLPAPSARVDAVGFLCPIPIVRTARKARDLCPGDVLELLADDRMVLVDLPAWCRSWSHEFLGYLEGPGYLRLFLRMGGSSR